MMVEADRLLLERLLEDDLDAEAQAQAVALLARDRQAADYVARQAQLLIDLRHSLKRRAVQAAIREEVPEARAAAASGPRLWWAIGVAACLAVAVLVLLLRAPASTDPASVVVEVISTQGVAADAPWEIGRTYAVRRVALETGRITVRLPNGVMLGLTAPLHGEFVSLQEFRLRHGNLMADVGPAGKGFVVSTTQARVVDQGTRFAVAVSPTQDVDVAVLQGLVDIHRVADPSAPVVSLSEGDGLRLDGSAVPRQLGMVRLSQDGEWLETARSDDLVSAISDNLMQADPRRFYGLIRGGMRSGVRAYTSGHTRTWQANTGGFPAELVGADVICTNSADRKTTAVRIALTLTAPCDLYVLPDARTAIPSWISRDFQDTGARLRCGAREPLALHAVYRRRILAPGVVELGSPHPGGGEVTALAMYGIAVKRLSP